MKNNKSLYDYCIENNKKYLLEEWDYEKNDELGITPYNIGIGYNKNVFWKCPKSKLHDWDGRVSDRVNGVNCPYCSNQRVCMDNCLATTHPQLAEEMHPTKNGEYTPYNVTAGSERDIIWKCKVCCHEWKSPIKSRKKGRGCPECNKEHKTSFREQAIYYYIKQAFPDAINSYKHECLEGKEIDIYIPSLKIGIEYDGRRFHGKENQIKSDEYKNEILFKEKINLIRVREEGCPNINMHGHFTINILYSAVVKYNEVDNVIQQIFDIIKTIKNIEIDSSDIDSNRDRFIIYSKFLKKNKKDSLLIKYPEIAEEWDYEKNYPLTPDMVVSGSSLKCNWICKKCGNKFEATLDNRTRLNSGCKKCNKKDTKNKNKDCLAITHPHLLKEWDYEKNDKLGVTPYNVTYGSSQKVHWICINCGNKYENRIRRQAKKVTNKCKECKNKKE